MFGSLAYSAKLAARRTAFGAGAAVLMLIGLGFLSAAAWIALAEYKDALFAATVIGCAYFGFGLILLGLSARRRPLPPPHPAAASPVAATSFAGLAGAFVQGIGAGMAARAAVPRRTPPPAE